MTSTSSLNTELCPDRARWDAAVNAQLGHPMQLWGWGQSKAQHGWRAERLLVREGDTLIGSAQVLYRALPFPFRSLAYIPRGPQAEVGKLAVVLAEVERSVRRHHAVVLTAEPDWEAAEQRTAALQTEGWRTAATQILIPRTLILDLRRSEDELLAEMTKKTRQYIRKSGREELDFRLVERTELQQCLEVYKLTAQRAGFSIHQDSYYLDIFDNLGTQSPVFGAFQGETVVAFLWLAHSDTTAFELYGGMTEEGSQLRANYALKWAAITAMKELGVTRYDFNGLLNDGVSQFKFGFASHEDLLAGSWDKPLSPLYSLYAKALPMARKGIRKVRGLLKR
ncbi:lipid II:glycine glycyltransferase (peptidoglycan interpeptide bridge formation enzyme) [Psychromicrobium silvestre]|uniref:Lipid II:glycine glycyltransferase (Peptidoglycan interpeptide bridge formation enzyme) n=1 Tax=Psychromicrobium silvestre TaxID=1645614 RepID=A0A7Y9LVZ2_9MICC|nr:peptidoglycan bridge formation glycyltransferase FemA/FemB family protein [Psychromicrobium silvestre]NYE96540.1 lipid II:glycine glycyltransferase (peptidoglycan interpeptide bridge formation enzyme) [Psychromicrobium silvestre]